MRHFSGFSTTFKSILKYSSVSNNHTHEIKRSHTIYMLSIEIDTKSLESVQQHQIVLLCKPYEMELSIMFL